MTAPRVPLIVPGNSSSAPDEYDDLLVTQRAARRTQLQGSLFAGSKSPDPARQAEVLTLADRTKLPADVVARRFDLVKQTVDAQSVDYDRILDETPGLASWLAHPDNAALGRHELAPLGRVDRATQLLRGLPVVTRGELAQAGVTGYHDLEASAGQLLAAYGRVDPIEAARTVAAANKSAAELRAIAPDYAKEFSAAMEAHGNDIDAASRAWAQSQPSLKRAEILGILRAINPAVAGVADVATNPRPVAKTVGAVLSALGAAIARPRGLLYSSVEGLVGSSPALAGGIAGAAAGSLAGPAGSIAGLAGGTFLGTLPVAIGGEINAELSKRGVDVTDPDQMALAFTDPSVMTAIRDRATRAGLTVAAVNALFSSFAGKYAAAAKGGSIAKVAGAAAGDASIQAGGQVVADLAGQTAGAKGDLSKVSAGRAIQSGVQMLGFAIGETALGASRRASLHPDPVRAAEEATTQAHDALAAERDAQLLQDLSAAVKEAPATATVPEKLRELVAASAGDGDAKAVYFQIADWDAHFAGQEQSPAEIAAKVLGDGGRAYDEAKATGAPFRIPLPDFVARVLTGDQTEGLIEHARTTSTGMSVREARDYLAALPATLEALAKDVASTPDPAAELQASVQAQLEATGTPASVATLQATVMRGLVKLAKRAGLDDNALVDRWKLTIRKGEAVSEGSLQQPAYHGSPHVFDEFSLHKIGTGEGNQSFGWGLYFAGKKSVADYYRRTLASKITVDGEAVEGASIFSSGVTAKAWAQRQLEETHGHVGNAIAEAELMLPATKGTARGKLVEEAIALLQDWKARDAVKVKTGGRLYHVDIPGDETMLAWDLPLSKQPAAVRAALEKLGVQEKFEKQKAAGQWTDDAAELSGEEIYNVLRMHVDPDGSRWSKSAEGASDLLAAEGVTGIRYLDATSRSRAGGSSNYVVFDDKLVKILQYEQRKGDAVRGQITFGQHGDVAIDLFNMQDRSTFLHESGHFYLEILKDLASREEAPLALKADYQTIRDWLGAEGDAALSREQHEKFARGFERYLMEGKAPSPELRKAFYRFKAWLTQIYKKATNLKVEMTDDVRGVFDRMLASDEEIAAAQQLHLPLFDDPKAAGMDDGLASKYVEAVADARQTADEELTAKMMKQLRRQESSEWKALRDPIREEIAGKVNQEPVYVAEALLRKGTKPDGSPLDEGVQPIKLHREAVKASYGDALYKALPHGVTAVDGVNPNIAAELLGFRNGKELVESLANAIPREQLIDRLADQEMIARHGERMTEEDVREMATAAVSNEQQSQLLRKEMEYLVSKHFAAFKGIARELTKRVPSTEAVRAQAEKMVGQHAIKDIRPDLFEMAIARAAREASAAFHKGDIEGAFAAKERQLLATEVLRASRNAKEAVDAALDEFRDIFKPDKQLADRRDMTYINAAREILAAFGIGKAEKGSSYLAQVEQYDPEAFAAIAAQVAEATQRAVDYRTMTYDDFVALRETVGGLWSLSRRARQMEIEGKLVDREQVQLELEARIREIRKAPAPQGHGRAPTAGERIGRGLMGVRAALRRVEHWVDAMDNGAPDGPFRRYVWTPISEAAAKYRLEMHAALERYHVLAKAIEPSLTSDVIVSPELGYDFNGKAELLGALLHTGNDSNLSKLLRGRQWGALTEDGFLDRRRWDAFTERMRKEGILTKADYDFVAGIWGLFESLKPGAQHAHDQLYGHFFSEVTAKPFEVTFADGTTASYKGGYAPAKADPWAAPDAAAHREAENVLRANGGAMFPSTGRGFTKSRVEAYAAPLVIDMRLVPSHLDAVLRFTHLQPRIVDAARLIFDRDLARTLSEVDPTITNDMLKPWLERSASQRLDTPGKGDGGRMADQFFRGVRKRAGMQILAANVVNAVQQLTGVSISAVKVAPKHLGAALWEYTRAPRELAAAIADKSDFMKTRSTHQVLELQRAIDEIMLNPTLLERGKDWMVEHGNALTAMSQNVVDTITWRGAYDEAVAAGSGEAEAVRIADSAVRETQGSPFPEDVSRFETGTAFHRLWSMFVGYFNMQANLLGTEFVKSTRDLGLRKGAGRLAYVYVLGFMVPAVLSEALMRTARGRPLDVDDDGPWDDVLGTFFGAQASTLARMVPVAGPVAEFTVREFISHRPDDRVSTSAAITTIERAAKAPKDVYDAIKERELKTAQIRDILTALGMLSGLPIGALSRPAAYLNDLRTDRATPSGPIDLTRGLLTGQPGPQR